MYRLPLSRTISTSMPRTRLAQRLALLHAFAAWKLATVGSHHHCSQLESRRDNGSATPFHVSRMPPLTGADTAGQFNVSQTAKGEDSLDEQPTLMWPLLSYGVFPPQTFRMTVETPKSPPPAGGGLRNTQISRLFSYPLTLRAEVRGAVHEGDPLDRRAAAGTWLTGPTIDT